MGGQDRFQYLDLATGDLDKSRAFYGGLLAWEFAGAFQPDGPENGVSFKTGSGQFGGMYLDPRANSQVQAPGGWTPYFQVENVMATVARARKLGGEILVPPTATPGNLGTYSIIRDPCGGTIGVWQG